MLHMKGLRERVALWVAPWLFVPYAYEREEAFQDLAEVAYRSRDAVWTSPRVLVSSALSQARLEGGKEAAARFKHGQGVGSDA